MEYVEQPGKKQFNMQGYLIELDNKNQRWTWNKWDYTRDAAGRKRVVRHRGGLEFMKIFPSLVGGHGSSGTVPAVFNRTQMEKALQKHGVDYIFLYQGETVEESGFHTVEEAECFYRLDACPAWNLTRYWYAYDWNMQSWCMYDAGTGDREFTPASAEPRAEAHHHEIESRPTYQYSSASH
jgi:hypothetical protein